MSGQVLATPYRCSSADLAPCNRWQLKWGPEQGCGGIKQAERSQVVADRIVDLSPSTFAARVANEKFEQSIANGPRSLAPGESAEAEFAVVGMPNGTRNDLSADNAFTVLVNTSRREAIAATEPTPSPTTEAPKS